MASDTPKGVSSRLLTMKFMQRAVASASSSPQTDDSSQSSKKRKLNNSAATAAEQRVSALIDQASIKAALEDQEAKRQAALAQHTASGAHWVLNTKLDKLNASAPSKPSLNVVYVGYGDIDSDDESGGEDAPQSGRTSTRKPKEVETQLIVTQKTNPEKEDGSNDESSSDGEDSSRKRKERHSDAGDGSSRSRSQSRPRTRPNDESKRAKDFREKRKKKEISLNKITSISSSGGASNSASSAACYICKQPGHKAASCPKSGSKRS
ncbi:hypothetical protein MKX08_004819 [Trichoderma sp. CBMAI-0020]|nr:hypothetical protein MKX08_004819 [Trichoderma sp. CBMAI-0020]